MSGRGRREGRRTGQSESSWPSTAGGGQRQLWGRRSTLTKEGWGRCRLCPGLPRGSGGRGGLGERRVWAGVQVGWGAGTGGGCEGRSRAGRVLERAWVAKRREKGRPRTQHPGDPGGTLGRAAVELRGQVLRGAGGGEALIGSKGGAGGPELGPNPDPGSVSELLSEGGAHAGGAWASHPTLAPSLAPVRPLIAPRVAQAPQTLFPPSQRSHASRLRPPPSGSPPPSAWITPQ